MKPYDDTPTPTILASDLTTTQKLFLELSLVVPPGCKTKRMLELEELIREGLEVCSAVLEHQDDPDLALQIARLHVDRVRQSGIDMDDS